MTIKVTSGREREARDRVKATIEAKKRFEEQRKRELDKRFHDKIGPAVEFAQLKAKGRDDLKVEEVRDYYFPKGFEGH